MTITEENTQIPEDPNTPKTAGDVLRGTLERLQSLPAHSADQMAYARAEYHAKQVGRLRYGWGAPERHVARRAHFTGAWAAKLETLSGKMQAGQGVMAALVGIRGNGKTQLAVELMRRATARLQSARFITAVGFFLKLKATFRKDASATEESVLIEFTRPQLLVLDEFEKRADSVWENNILFELLNRRYNARPGPAGKDTVLIANDSKQGFDDYVGASVVSRINETGGLVECTWPSFRES